MINQLVKLAALISMREEGSLQVSIMAAIRHPNVVMFMGICLSPVCIVTEFCARGSLSDVIKKAASRAVFAQQLDWPRRTAMALDAAKVTTASILLRISLSGCSNHTSLHVCRGLACLPACLSACLHKAGSATMSRHYTIPMLLIPMPT